MRELLRRIAYLFNRRRLEREMADEMAYHRELMSSDGRADFGSDLRLREDAREIWGWTWLDRLRQDLTYGARVLRKSPGFTLTALLVLALGIGVPLTAFRAVLADFGGGSIPDPSTLVQLTRSAPGVSITKVSYPELAFYTANAKSFRSLIAVLDRHPAVFGDTAATSEPVQIAFVTSNYFPEFGVTPIQGRALTPPDERPDSAPAALLGESFWKRRLGGDPAIVGGSIRVNGKVLSVVGIIPASSRIAGDVWMPLSHQPYVIEGSSLLTDWNSALDLYARLKPGVTPQASQQETLALAARLREVQPDHVWRGEYLSARPVLQFGGDSQEFQTIVTAAALVLLILVAACANLGTLVLARGVAREREIRTRMALGADRLRVVRQLFTESLLLAMLSGLCGLLLSSIVLQVLRWQNQPTASIVPDWRVVAITFGASLLAASVFGLPPALRLTSLVPRAGRARTAFLAIQVAASCLLLVLSSTLINGRERLRGAHPGFDYRQLVWVDPGLKTHGYSDPAAQAYLDQLRSRAAKLPGAAAASVAWLSPWGDLHSSAGWLGRQFDGNMVDPQFLDTTGIRLVRGRNFRPAEQSVAIVTEAMASALWPGEEALGKTLPWEPRGVTVIGVVRNASTTAIGPAQPLEFYLPHSQKQAPESVLLLRVSGRAQDSLRGLQDAAYALDPRLQPTVQTVAAAYDREMEKASGALAAIAILGTVATLLSAIGLAGLGGYTVAQRTREIGLRIALGARSSQVIRAILAPMSRPIAIGLVCGALGGSAVAQLLRSGIPTMSGLPSLDPLAYLMAAAFFLAVMALSILAPGLRATRISPSTALRQG